jgi:hypothetical protein
MTGFLAPKQPSTEKNGNQCAWHPVSIQAKWAKLGLQFIKYWQDSFF